ncbi:MAG: hypothetical protein ACO3LE_04110 [Bdellovibrionota bacterium]
MAKNIERRTFVIEELLRLTEEILLAVDFDEDSQVEALIRQRSFFFNELLDTNSNEASAEQQALWLTQLKHLQARDQTLRARMLSLLKNIRTEMDHAKDQKIQILGDLVRGTQIETSR